MNGENCSLSTVTRLKRTCLLIGVLLLLAGLFLRMFLVKDGDWNKTYSDFNLIYNKTFGIRKPPSNDSVNKPDTDLGKEADVAGIKVLDGHQGVFGQTVTNGVLGQTNNNNTGDGSSSKTVAEETENNYGSVVTDEAMKILSPDYAGTDTCRRTLFQLWTRGNDTSSFPNCSAMFDTIANGKKNHLKSQYHNVREWKVPRPHDTSSVLNMMNSSCEEFRSTVDFATRPASKEEAEYPIAYVFLPYRNMAQAVRFFRMIYQPQNAYCITYDTKTDEEVKKSILALASCFPDNVHINPNLTKIYYSTYTLLYSVMGCMNVLRESPIKWRYVQVVSWNDVPLKTNWELVQIFKVFNGSQDCELMRNNVPEFLTLRHDLPDRPQPQGPVRRPIPPGGLTFYKGSFSTTMSKEFVDWMFTDPVAIRYYEYLNGTMFPDEFLWPTLIHNVHINPPGGFPGQCLVYYMQANEKKPYMSRFQVWHWQTEAGEKTCKGFLERYSCVYGIGDLDMIIKRMELVAHKIYEEFQPALLYCLEEWYWERVCMGKKTGLDVSFYKNLPSVRYHNSPDSEKENFVCPPAPK